MPVYQYFPNSIRPAGRRALQVTRWTRDVLCAVIGVYAVSSVGCAWREREHVAANVFDARQLALRGVEAWQQGETQQAEQLFEDALESCPMEERAHRYYAELLWQRGEQTAALEHMRSAAKLSNNAVDVLVRIGQMRLEQGELAHAFAWSERAVARDDLSADAWALRAKVLQRQGRWEESLLSCHRALNLNPNDSESEFRTALLYRQLSRPRRALATLNAIAARHPKTQLPAEVLDEESLALQALGRHETAALRLAEAAERQPTAERLCRLCRLQRSLGRGAEAHRTILQAAAIDSKDLDVQRLYLEMGAEGRVEHAAVLDPELP